MITHAINPIILETGPIVVHWYGLLFTLGIILCVLLVRKLLIKQELRTDNLYNLTIYMVVGAIIGARLGYVVFYNFSYYLKHLDEIIRINEGGLSSHGATIGLVIAALLFYYFNKKRNSSFRFYKYSDLVVIGLPLIITCIRIGNFINSEIVGRATDLPWGVVFSLNNDTVARHPVQIYEALAALVIYIIMLLCYKFIKNKKPYLMTFIFIFIYFGSRFFIEFTKEFQVTSSYLTMGQWLSILPIIISLIYFGFLIFKKK